MSFFTLFCLLPANDPWAESCCQYYMYVCNVLYVKIYILVLLLLLLETQWNAKSECLRKVLLINRIEEYYVNNTLRSLKIDKGLIKGLHSWCLKWHIWTCTSCRTSSGHVLRLPWPLMSWATELLTWDLMHFFIVMIIDCTNNNNCINKMFWWFDL